MGLIPPLKDSLLNGKSGDILLEHHLSVLFSQQGILYVRKLQRRQHLKILPVYPVKPIKHDNCFIGERKVPVNSESDF